MDKVRCTQVTAGLYEIPSMYRFLWKCTEENPHFSGPPPLPALQVHEIEPGYSRGDFALPGHVGFITEVRGTMLEKIVAVVFITEKIAQVPFPTFLRARLLSQPGDTRGRPRQECDQRLENTRKRCTPKKNRRRPPEVVAGKRFSV